VRAPRIYEGASEIQREIIARSMFRAVEAARATTTGEGAPNAEATDNAGATPSAKAPQ